MKSQEFRALMASGAALLALAAPPALAQTPVSEDQPAPAAEENPETIVVTGTLLRGIAPPGSQTLAVTRDDAIATGATSTTQLLANLPQVGDFNRKPITQGVQNTQLTVNAPDLRGLGAAILAGGSSATLLLLDGHRMPGMGVRQTIPDADAIPPGAIERVEIVTDGGSSTYGADAVGGVVNYITRKRFDGVDVSGTFGFGDDYKTASFDITAGKDWGTGSLYATYSFNWHDEIYGRDRDWVQNRAWSLPGQPAGDLTCTPGNIAISSGTPAVTTVYALPGLTAGLGARCDNAEYATIYPMERRHSVFAGFTQALTDNLEISIKAFFTTRFNQSDGGPLSATATVYGPLGTRPAGAVVSPFYQSTADANAGLNETISVNFAPVLGNSTMQTSKLTAWGIAHDLTWKIGDGWRARALFNYGRGSNVVNNDMINATPFTAGVANGTINPYNLAAPGNAAALAAVLDWRNYGKGRHELINYRAIVDGPLFDLPGGAVNVALGAEYLIEDYKVSSGLGSRLTNVRPSGAGHRNTKALFGELFLPVFGEGNRIPFFHSLAFSASGRYDKYSDFGGTFNPKLAVTWEPVEWLKIRANWSKSFQAPSLADGAGVITTSITVVQRVFAQKPGLPSTPTQVTAFVGGGGENLKPQTASIWSIGGDIKAPFYEGLTLSATYWNIKFKDLIAIPPVTSTALFRDYPTLATTGTTTQPLTAAQLQAFMDLAPANNSQLASYLSHPQDVYVLIDGRRSNFSALNTSGLDFSARLDVPTGFGSIYARVSGTYVLTREEAPVAGLPFNSNADSFNRLRLSSTLGAKVGKLRGQITWLHSDGVNIVPSALNLQQDHIDAYDTFNLFAQYEFGGSGLTEDLSLTLNVDNLFDQDPPLSYAGTAGYGNGFTLGRVVQFGIRKKF